MKLKINGIKCSSDKVTFFEKGFSKRMGEEKSFEIEMDFKDFRSRFIIQYDKCIAELKHDDILTGKFDPPFSGATGYPSFGELLKLSGHERMEFIHTYFVFDILRLFFKEDATNQEADWIVSRFDLMEKSGEKIVIKGKVISFVP